MRHWFALVILGLALATPALAAPPTQWADAKGDRLDVVTAVIPTVAPAQPDIEFVGPANEAPALAEPPAVSAIRKDHFPEDVCEAISREAKRRKIPEEFFARLIWRESLFDPNAVSPKG